MSCRLFAMRETTTLKKNGRERPFFRPERSVRAVIPQYFGYDNGACLRAIGSPDAYQFANFHLPSTICTITRER